MSVSVELINDLLKMISKGPAKEEAQCRIEVDCILSVPQVAFAFKSDNYNNTIAAGGLKQFKWTRLWLLENSERNCNSCDGHK